MATFLDNEIRPPRRRTRSRARLLDAALPIAEDDLLKADPGNGSQSTSPLVRGVKFCPTGCDGLVRQATRVCEYPFDDADPEDTNELLPLPDLGGTDGLGPDSEDMVEFASFLIAAGDEGPAYFGYDFLSDRAETRLRERYSAEFANALLTGEDSNGQPIGSPSLRSSVTDLVAAVTPLDEALYVMEELAAELDGIEVLLHASPGLFTLLVNEYGLEQADDSDPTSPFLTPTGHSLVGDAGHDGNVAPYTLATQDDEEPTSIVTAEDGSWLYATLPIGAWVGDADTVGEETARFGRARNRMRTVHLRHALYAFEPCFVAAVQVEVPEYDVTVPPSTGD